MNNYRDEDVVLAYFGIDGACAAAAMLRSKPDAIVATASARSIADVLRGLEGAAAIDVCGVGVACPHEDLASALHTLSESGAHVTWHCGRGYLDNLAAMINETAAINFDASGLNTAAVSTGHDDLAAIAGYDKNIDKPRGSEKASPDELNWLDAIEASISEYLKYLDDAPYRRVVRALATGVLDAESEALVARFRRVGWRNMLHGGAPPIRALKKRIQRCAEADRPVLILGESGVGKEHVAHLIWERSKRAAGPFVPVNCATFAGNSGLANSDLFGHRKGAFTGATHDRKGRFLEADGGILYLDELGEMPVEVQAKLLRVLEDGWVTPEGADRPDRQVNVRVVAATNADLGARVREGTFRADLYYRLSALPLRIPPLRERIDDIGDIVDQRIASLRAEGFDARPARADRAALRDYHWPGNVRQLIKVIDQCVILGEPVATILAEEPDCSPDTQPHASLLLPQHADGAMPMSEMQQRYARHVWDLHGGNYAATARALGVTAATLRYSYLNQSRPGKSKES